MEKPESTKDRLLAVGIAKFAEKGFAGTTVDEIVEAAKVNKRMVYHYFGSKEKLYQAALTDVYQRLGNMEVTLLAEPHEVEQMIRELIETYFTFLQQNPEFVNLLLWENLNRGRGLEGADFELTKDPTMEHLDITIQHGIAIGKLRPDIKVKHLLISLIGLCLIYFSNRYTLSKILQIDLSSDKNLSEGVDHVLQLVLKGILANN
ncbi:MAG TPA: TetR/AcrR family transcriptional regulator [Opitutales bacterium]|nr:TetR/AcrR family transcriptional regulator [Opitutales bacterium]